MKHSSPITTGNGKTVDDLLVEAAPFYQSVLSKRVRKTSGQSKKGWLKKQEEWKRVVGKAFDEEWSPNTQPMHDSHKVLMTSKSISATECGHVW